MSQLVDLICSPPTSTNATPALASFPTLIPSPSAPISSHTPSSAPLATGGNALRIRPHVDIPTSLLVKQQDAMSTPTLSAASQTLSPDASIPLAADLTMTPIEALIALGQAEGDTEHRGSVDQMMLPDAALAAGGDDEAAESASQVHEAVRPAVLRTRISISEASPSGTFSPPDISPTDLTGPSSANASSTSGPPRLPLIVASTIDSLPIPILALPATSTADRVRPLILARASHSDAITSTTTYNCAQNGFGASLDVTLGSPTVEFGRRTSLTFKDAIGRRMGRGSCPTPPLANREQASGAQHGSTPYNTPDRYPAVGISRDAQPASPVPTANGQGVHRRPSWKIVLPPLPALSAVSAGMERLAVSQGSTDGSEDCRLLTDDSVRSHGAMSLGLDLDENAARRIVYNRTPYPLSEEEENHDPFSAFAGAAHVVPPKSAQQPDRKRNVGPKRVDLSALHPSDRQHGPDSDAKVGGDSDVDYDSEDENGDVYSASTAGVRTSLLGSSAAGCGPAKVSSTRDEDDIEFIDPFSGSRISVKEANSQILSDAVRLRPGNPVLVRKSSLGALGGSAVSGAISASRDKFSLDGRHGEQASERGEMDGTATGKYGAVNVSGLPGSTSRSSRIAAFFSRSRTPSTTAMSVNTAPSLHSYPPPTGSAPRVVSKTGASRAGIVQGKNCTQHAAEPVVADGESWGSTGMGKQWSNDSQSAMEGDGLLV